MYDSIRLWRTILVHKKFKVYVEYQFLNLLASKYAG